MNSAAKRDPRQHLDILLIENDPAMASLTKIAFEEAGLRDGITCIPDGAEALTFLQNEENQNDELHPNLIFLDLHLPKKSGLEVLQELKTNVNWMATPVVVVSGHSDPKEIRRVYELHASCYVRKPNDLDQFLQFAKTCYEFWGNLVTLPPREIK